MNCSLLLTPVPQRIQDRCFTAHFTAAQTLVVIFHQTRSPAQLNRDRHPVHKCGLKHFPIRTWPQPVRRARANITPVFKTIGVTAIPILQHPAHIVFRVNRVEHYPQTQRGLPAHVIGHVMRGTMVRPQRDLRLARHVQRGRFVQMGCQPRARLDIPQTHQPVKAR